MAEPMPSVTINEVGEAETRADIERKALIGIGLINPDGTKAVRPFAGPTPEEFHAQHRRPTAGELPSGVTVEAARRFVKHAHAGRVAAQAKLDKAKSAAARGQQLLDQCHVQIASLGDPETEIGQMRAEAHRRWANDGGKRPAVWPVPHPLAERMRKRIEADQRIEGLEAGQTLLDADVVEAQEELAGVANAIGHAIERLVIAEGEAIADELLDAEKRACDLRRDLESMAMLWVVNTNEGRPRSISLSAKLKVLLTSAPLNVGQARPGEKRSERWSNFVDRLKADPDAQLE